MDSLTLTSKIAAFLHRLAVTLPDDVTQRLAAMAAAETDARAQAAYAAMEQNQRLAAELDRPCCQDTGLPQFFARVGAQFPLLAELPQTIPKAVRLATAQTPLRPNAVQTFADVNTGDNTGEHTPWIDYDIVPGCGLELTCYLAGGGCSLPGRSRVFPPGEGYAGVADYVLETVAEYGANACPPLLIGVGVGASADTAAVLSKKALLRRIGTKNPNERAAAMEAALTKAVNGLNIGPQGLGGRETALAVHIEQAARHTATLAVGVSFGCWSLRRGVLLVSGDTVSMPTHSGAAL